MQRFILAGALLVSIVSSANIAAAQAPTDKGVVNEDGDKTKAEKSAAENTEETAAGDDADLAALKKQIVDLQAELNKLSGMLAKISDSEKELEKIQGKMAILEGDNSALADRVKTLESEKSELAGRVKDLEGDNASLQERLAKVETAPKERTTLKPAFVKSAVRFFNHEGRSVKMNVNGVWHTVKAGENTIWVPYAPVHIYRYTGAEPRTFWKWKEHMDGYVMDFDIGKATE